ncbi:hypothetical protein [Nocardia sp. NBC_01329]|uniref:hypothetical protein n=1 Tax=Nocardia sp. NBC_01329 TaxID=2903594 RepID=UPI002E123B98|nr:hypothetical protein OG405_01720 [Nocardia sp. NBC_01329]
MPFEDNPVGYVAAAQVAEDQLGFDATRRKAQSAQSVAKAEARPTSLDMKAAARFIRAAAHPRRPALGERRYP